MCRIDKEHARRRRRWQSRCAAARARGTTTTAHCTDRQFVYACDSLRVCTHGTHSARIDVVRCVCVGGDVMFAQCAQTQTRMPRDSASTSLHADARTHAAARIEWHVDNLPTVWMDGFGWMDGWNGGAEDMVVVVKLLYRP